MTSKVVPLDALPDASDASESAHHTLGDVLSRPLTAAIADSNASSTDLPKKSSELTQSKSLQSAKSFVLREAPKGLSRAQSVNFQRQQLQAIRKVMDGDGDIQDLAQDMVRLHRAFCGAGLKNA